MKSFNLPVILLFLFVSQFQPAYSQKTEIKPTFKIVGDNIISIQNGSGGKMSVEYDTASVDHLYISEFRKTGLYINRTGVSNLTRLVTKTRFLFKGKKFNLNNLAEYSDKGELVIDGTLTDNREDESVVSVLLYKEGKLQQKTFYYPNGNKQMLISGSEKILNGEYKIWYPNGQLSFSGNYRYNLKNREFQQFDETGALLKKGVYSCGKLISGDAVVQDITFEKPDQLARYAGGDNAFSDYLRMKTSELKMVKDMGMGVAQKIIMNMTISKTGGIEKIDIYGLSNPSDNEILNVAFGDFPGFLPATVEDIPVSSILPLELLYTNKGLQTEFGSEDSTAIEKSDSLMDPPYTVVEEMPDFPGGDTALRSYLAGAVRYPKEAAEKGIQGKVFVNFVIEANGSISKVHVVGSIDPIFDAEAVRVIRNMPRWTPGRQSGNPVRVAFTVPINFMLK